MKPRTVEAGKVYASKHGGFRRVIHVQGGWVIYNSGGDRNHSCKLRSFKAATQREPMVACLTASPDLFSLAP